MKKALRAYKEAKETANKADRAYELEPENEALEKAFDEAYENEYKAFENLAKAIEKASAGLITEQKARTMIRLKYDQLESIVERMA